MARVHLSLSVKDDHIERLGEVAKAAEKAGMTVEQRHAGLGVITGSVDADKLAKIRAIAGVASVEEERKVGIAPPGSPIQ